MRYGRQLRQIASHIDSLIKGFDVKDETVYPSIVTALRKYADALDTWAKHASGKILMDVALRDEQTWLIYARDMSKGIKDQIRNTDVGAAYQLLLNDQVRLIKSLPLNAAQRVHDLATRAVIEGGRSDEISGLIMAIGGVSKSRANTIARTEISRATSVFTQTRAQALGSDGYIWRTSEDSDVRHSHKEMNGKFVAWDKPPTLDKMTGHAGCLPNCRCYPEPVIPED